MIEEAGVIPAQCRYGKLRRKVEDKSDYQSFYNPEQENLLKDIINSALGRIFLFIMKISKKTKGLILIALGISLALVGLFILNSNKQEPVPTPRNTAEKTANPIPISETKEKTILKINDQIIESEIAKEITVYDFMSQLQQENKISFKAKNYTGMGEFIEEINGLKNGEKNWIYYVNGEKANIGISNYKIKPGDVVSWNYENNN